jgi:hypothetical protein
MRREWRWLAAATAALVLGTVGADTYVRVATPLYRLGAEWLIEGKPWQINSIGIRDAAGDSRRELWMTGELKSHSWDLQPSARADSRVQLAAVLQNPVVFWLVLLLVPVASIRSRVTLLGLGLPVFLLLEIATTSCQLVNALVQTAAMLDGEANPLTWTERWSRFLESGGRLVIDVCAALFCVSLLRQWERRRPAFIIHRLAD